MKNVLLIICLAFGLPLFGQPPGDWNTRANKVWDPNHVLKLAERAHLNGTLASGPITTFVAVIRDFEPESIGQDWAVITSAFKPADNNYYPAMTALKLIEGRFSIGEADPSRQSMVILVTTKRGDPRTRWAVTISDKIANKITGKEVIAAYEAFGTTISSQGGRGPAEHGKLAEGLQKAVAILFAELRK
jgi:hypothetical protein